MNGIEITASALESTGQMLGMFLSDLSDEDLLVCPVEGANHIAWQVGHIISTEFLLMTGNLPGASYPIHSADFETNHSRDSNQKQQSKGFLTKAEYLDLMAKTRAITLTALRKLTDADLDKATTGRLAAKAPTLGKILLLCSNHTLMHMGQFSVIRRKLGKPVLF